MTTIESWEALLHDATRALYHIERLERDVKRIPDLIDKSFGRRRKLGRETSYAIYCICRPEAVFSPSSLSETKADLIRLESSVATIREALEKDMNTKTYPSKNPIIDLGKMLTLADGIAEELSALILHVTEINATLHLVCDGREMGNDAKATFAANKMQCFADEYPPGELARLRDSLKRFADDCAEVLRFVRLDG